MSALQNPLQTAKTHSAKVVLELRPEMRLYCHDRWVWWISSLPDATSDRCENAESVCAIHSVGNCYNAIRPLKFAISVARYGFTHDSFVENGIGQKRVAATDPSLGSLPCNTLREALTDPGSMRL